MVWYLICLQFWYRDYYDTGHTAFYVMNNLANKKLFSSFDYCPLNVASYFDEECYRISCIY